MFRNVTPLLPFHQSSRTACFREPSTSSVVAALFCSLRIRWDETDHEGLQDGLLVAQETSKEETAKNQS